MTSLRTALLLALLAAFIGLAIVPGTAPGAYAQQCPNGVCE